MKFRKSEEKILEAAKKEQQRQQAIINEVEAKEKKRAARIAANDAEHNRAIVDYNGRCRDFAHDQEPFFRLCKLIFDTSKSPDFGMNPGGYLKASAKFYNLQPFIDMVNKLCPPGAKPPQKKEINIEDLED